jgi:hypothetical protein
MWHCQHPPTIQRNNIYDKVTYDRTKEKSFFVYKDNGRERCFRLSEQGLFYLDTATATATDEGGTVMVNTVAGTNTKRNVLRDYRQAGIARETQNRIGRPSLQTFLKIVENNLLTNCLITRAEVLAAECWGNYLNKL